MDNTKLVTNKQNQYDEEIDRLNKEAQEKTEYENPVIPYPILDYKGYFGLISEVVEVAQINSESSDSAIASTFISYFCTLIGRDVYQWIGDQQQHCRPYTIIAGKSGKGRKGSSQYLVDRIFKRVDDLIFLKHPLQEPLKVKNGGLYTPEGIANQIRDPMEIKDPKGDSKKDLGIPDKRMLFVEAEFAGIFAQCKGEKSSLSMTIRNYYDGNNFEQNTRNSPLKATAPHVLWLGHITADELRHRVINSVEISNGFLNRFNIFPMKRERFIPQPQRTDDSVINRLAEKVYDIYMHYKNKTVEICFEEAAGKMWDEHYMEVTKERPGIIGSLCARHDSQTRMYAMIFAVMDKKDKIYIEHLEAAIAWITYAEKSLEWLFHGLDNTLKHDSIKDTAMKILDKLKEKQQMSATDITKMFSNNLSSSDKKAALQYLIDLSPTVVVLNIVKEEGRRGRGKEVYTYVQ